MQPYVKAIAWKFYHPYRWRLLLGLIYIILAYTVGVTCVSEELSLSDRVLYSLWLHPIIGFMVSPLAVFSNTYKFDLLKDETSIPGSMLTAPVSAKEIVFWPMLLGVLFIMAYWVIMVQCMEVLWFESVSLPTFWPPVLAGCVMAWTQVFAWRPFGASIARVFFAAIGYVSLMIIALICSSYSVVEPVIVAIFVGLILVAYYTAIDSVYMARSGEKPSWKWFKIIFEKLENLLHPRPPKFTNAAQAMNWYEWRVNGINLPIAMGFISPVLFFISALGYLIHGQWIFEVFIFLLWMPAILSSALGIAFAGFGHSNGTTKVTTIQLVKPNSCKQIIKSKYRTALKSIVVTYSIIYVAIFILLCVTDSVPWMESLKQQFTVFELIVVIPLLLMAPIVICWIISIVGMSFGFTGRFWVVTVGVVLLFGTMLFLVTMDSWIHNHPELQKALRNYLPYFLLILVSIKIVTTVWVLRINLGKQLMRFAEVKNLIGISLGLFLAVWSLSYWLIPRGPLEWYYYPMSIVVLLPMLSVSISPLALYWNRHR